MLSIVVVAGKMDGRPSTALRDARVLTTSLARVSTSGMAMTFLTAYTV